MLFLVTVLQNIVSIDHIKKVCNLIQIDALCYTQNMKLIRDHCSHHLLHVFLVYMFFKSYKVSTPNFFDNSSRHKQTAFLNWIDRYVLPLALWTWLNFCRNFCRNMWKILWKFNLSTSSFLYSKFNCKLQT